jgi:hypothetical protein
VANESLQIRFKTTEALNIPIVTEYLTQTKEIPTPQAK